ncbi:CRISPR-associated endonuclease Cas2 [Olsenella sp. Marseille-P4559]|uniref:CRISPR-associated endonuclease Cas2 n=1 Tax=Olsenella sp. Marseille-P4559 TaxID=2364795 RepID=UPI00102F665C|nr:CRISPR-associated endonuclease Cas2 [Olsenella sp. Marseille-P4559]
MYVVITYDVDTTTPAGQKRLRRVAKICVNYGQRVQNSVFECDADAATQAELRHKLTEIIDVKHDSLRFYNLGDSYKSKITHIGAKEGYDPQGFLSL